MEIDYQLLLIIWVSGIVFGYMMCWALNRVHYCYKCDANYKQFSDKCSVCESKMTTPRWATRNLK